MNGVYLATGPSKQKLAMPERVPVIGDYRILGRMGEGTFSEVLKCQSLVDGRLYACKKMKQKYDSLEQVNSLREIQALRRLNPHSNIIQLSDIVFDRHNRNLSLIFEIMDMNIYELIKDRRSYLQESRVKLYMYQLCKAIYHMHRNGIFHLIDNVIKRVLQERQPLTRLHPGLTAQDIFFSQVASVEDIFGLLVEYQSDALQMLGSSADKLQLGTSVAVAVQSMFSEAVKYRESHSSMYTGTTCKMMATEYLPWTACGGRTGGRLLLMEELNCLIEVWEGCVSDPISGQDSQLFWGVYSGLAQQLFNGYQQQLQSMNDRAEFEDDVGAIREEYEKERDRFIEFALDQGQLVIAVELAETFHNFHTLIKICEQREDREQLRNYFSQFKAVGFSDVLFKYYLNNGNLKFLLSFSEYFPKELEAFLSAHNHLLWIHHLATREYNKAGKCLSELAENEEDTVARKKTMLSIAKLSLVAEDKDACDSEAVKEINRQLRHIEYQEMISESALTNEGLDIESMPPLKPNKVVELFVDDQSAGVDDFLIALEYVASVFESTADQKFIDELLVYIWGNAILRDDWDAFQTDDPLSALEETFFMSIVSKGIADGLSMSSLLPDIDDLLQSNLMNILKRSKTFLFLIKAAYENIGNLTQ